MIFMHSHQLICRLLRSHAPLAVLSMIGALAGCDSTEKTTESFPAQGLSVTRDPGSPPLIRVSSQGLEKPAPGFEPTVSDSAKGAGSANETLSFILRYDATSCSPLILEEGALSVKLFEMRPVNLDKPSFEEAKVGKHYDPLPPLDLNRVCPEKGENHSWIWADVHIRQGAPQGSHAIQIGPKGGDGATIEVTVWNHTLPVQPSMPIYLNVIPWFIVNGHHGGWHADEALLGVKYVRALLDHRMYPMNQHLAPLKLENGGISLGNGPGSFRAMTLELVPKQSKVFVPIEPRDPSQLSPEYLAAIEKMIQSEGLKGRAVSYLWDEPHGDELDRTEAAAKLLRKHAPSLEVLVTTPYATRFQRIVDHFVPVAEHFKPADYVNRPFWLYISCMSHGCGEPPFIGETSGAPDLVTDRPAVFARVFPWVLEKIGAKAGLYFNTVEAYNRGEKDPWTSNYLFTGNGDGTLFYPDRKNHEPVASIRLKLLRRGVQDIEYLRAASITGKSEIRKSLDVLVQGSTQFDRDQTKYEALRLKIGEALSEAGNSNRKNPVRSD